ncbi:hypothetical protein Bpfe_027318 [Biomphalaria pfeifferi]|uniref:Secreted protein n=1 Tax=Biomphalaria pfeifferi TaxID=112525 RepID=A0AAD8AWY5_BIOPF|nr:hypothetical protein Bpfe_027318 [Biomphalaria pfeifferi]
MYRFHQVVLSLVWPCSDVSSAFFAACKIDLTGPDDLLMRTYNSSCLPSFPAPNLTTSHADFLSLTHFLSHLMNKKKKVRKASVRTVQANFGPQVTAVRHTRREGLFGLIRTRDMHRCVFRFDKKRAAFNTPYQISDSAFSTLCPNAVYHVN